jgi:hypothetical protein
MDGVMVLLIVLALVAGLGALAPEFGSDSRDGYADDLTRRPGA